MFCDLSLAAAAAPMGVVRLAVALSCATSAANAGSDLVAPRCYTPQGGASPLLSAEYRQIGTGSFHAWHSRATTAAVLSRTLSLVALS
jgi:hypothetical protein